MAVQPLAAGRLDAGLVTTRVWTRVPVVLAAADDTIRIPVPPVVGRIALLRIESGVETVRPVVDGVQAPLASVSADWRLDTHGQVFTPQGPAIRDADGIVIGQRSIDVVPTLQGSPTLPATVYVSLAIQEGAGAVAIGATGTAASDVDMRGYAIFNAETPDGSDVTQLTNVAYVTAAVAGVVEDLDEILFLSYSFDTATSPTVPATPAAGKFRLNHATPASATGAYLNETDEDGIARGPEIATWALNFATAPSVITLRSRTDPTKFAKYYVSGANTDSGTYDRLVLTYVDGNGGAFTAAESVAVFFTPAPSVAVGYQPLKAVLTTLGNLVSVAHLVTIAGYASIANLTAFVALTGAADKVVAFTGAGAMAVYDFPATARTFLASFPTPAFAAAVSMAANKITNLAMGDSAGNAIRYEARGPGTLPTLTGLTTRTPTGYTLAALTATDEGRFQQWVSATATARLAGVTEPGTRIVGRFTRKFSVSTAGAVGSSGSVLRAQRDDGVIATFGRNAGSYFLYRWTDLNTFSTAIATIGYNTGDSAEPYVRLGQASAAANVLVEFSIDGVTWTTAYSGTPTAVFGGVGDVTSVGDGGFMANATGIFGHQLERQTVG